MRLHLDSSATGPLAAPQAAGGSNSSSSVALRETAGSKDSISISATSAALTQVSTDRASRIQQLSNAVTAGTYQLSSNAIGRAIVAQAFN